MILSFQTDRYWQTVQTQIRLFLLEQSDQGLYGLPFRLHLLDTLLHGPCQANLVLITYASSEGSGEPAHPRSLTRTSAARSYKHWVKRNLQTESQIPSPSEWLGMRSYNLSWRNAQRHKFAWRGSYGKPPNSNFMMNTVNFWWVQIFTIFMVPVIFFYRWLH